MSRLPRPYRQAFLLCHLEGLSNAEAARTGCARGTIDSRLAWARRRGGKGGEEEEREEGGGEGRKAMRGWVRAGGKERKREAEAGKGTVLTIQAQR